MVRIDFINVGYGDAVLLQFLSEEKDVYRVLVDCGDLDIGAKPLPSARICAADYLSALQIDTLDLVLISHLHLDHVGGLLQVAEKVRIRELWTNYLPPEDCRNGAAFDISVKDCGARCLVKALDTLCSALAVLKAEGCRIRCMTEKERMPLPGGERNSLELYAPDRSLLERQKTVLDHVCHGVQDEAELHELDLFINNTSLRAAFTSEGKTVFLPGDTYGAFLERCGCAPCDLLKVPHHGHLDGITEKLLRKMHPAHAVISVSDDRTDDCPSPVLLDRLKRADIAVSFTDAVQMAGIEPDHHSAVRFTLGSGGITRSYVKI